MKQTAMNQATVKEAGLARMELRQSNGAGLRPARILNSTKVGLFSAILLTLAVLSAAPAFGQNTGTGLPPFGSFTPGSGIDTVNNQNMNVHLDIPIISVPGRGLNFSYNQLYDSLIWKNGGGIWGPTLNASGIATWGWQTPNPAGSLSYTGYSYDYGNTCALTGGDWSGYAYSGFIYTDTQGTKHSIPSVYFTYDSCFGLYANYPTGYALDNSGYYLNVSGPGGSAVVTDSSGIQYAAGSSNSLTDRNGNITSMSSDAGGALWTATTGANTLYLSSGTNYVYTNGSGTTVATVVFQTLNIKTNFGCSGMTEYSGTATLPSSITFADGSSYTFSYEPTPSYSSYTTGRLQRVAMSAGGYIEYDYGTTNDGINCTDGTTLNMTRNVNDGTATHTWTFARSGSTDSTTTVTAPLLSYNSAGNQTVYTFNSSGQETSRQIYQGNSSSGTLLRTINTTWASGGTPATAVTILENGSTQSEIDTTYDTNGYGLLQSISNYDWGSGAHGSKLRETDYTYLGSISSNYNAGINLLSSMSIKDGSGTVQYRQDTIYDGVSLGSCPTGVSQHDYTNYGCSFVYRGNATAVTTYTSPAGPSGGITKNFTYDVLGNLLTAQLNCCQTKTWLYSSTTNYSFPDSVTSGSTTGTHLTTSSTYGSSGQVATVTDPNNLTTSYSYDSSGRLTTVTRPDSTGITTNYGSSSNSPVTVTTPIDSSDSSVQITSTDDLGRPSTVTLEDGGSNIKSIVQYQYDQLGRQNQVSNPYTSGSPSYWSTVEYDALGRPTETILPNGSYTAYSYSTNTVTVTDPSGKQKKSVGDGLGRLTSVYEPDVTNSNALTVQTSYTYDVLNDQTGVSQGSQTRTYAYDHLGRLTAATTPEANSSAASYVYDNFNNLTQRTDARGVVTTYGYDGLNRPTGSSYNVTGASGVPATASVAFTYGTSASSCNNGMATQMTDGVGSETYTYSGSLCQLSGMSKVINGTTYAASYAYNLAGELTSLTYPSGRVVSPSYDTIGRLSQVTSSSVNYQSSVAYNAGQQVTGFSYGNGVAASFGYSSDRLQLTSLSYALSGTTLFGLNYYYAYNSSNCATGTTGNNGQIQCIRDTVDNGRSANYTYDALYRLTAAGTAGSTGYSAWGLSETYDRYGNRTAQSVTAGSGPLNAVTVSATTNHITTSGYSYDNNGNMTNDGYNTLTYDAENHAVSATNSSSSGGYVYDGNGLRVEKCVPNCSSPTTATVYIFSGTQVAVEYDNGAAVGSPSREYIYGTALLAKIESGSTLYYHQDHLSNRVLTSSSGSVAGQQGHYPFGESWYLASTTTKWEFTTYERDAESGNDYAQARYYVNRMGRFSSSDPLGAGASSASNPQSWNLYSYVGNDPINLIDPTGLDDCYDGNGVMYLLLNNGPCDGSGGGGMSFTISVDVNGTVDDSDYGLYFGFNYGLNGSGSTPGGIMLFGGGGGPPAATNAAQQMIKKQDCNDWLNKVIDKAVVIDNQGQPFTPEFYQQIRNNLNTALTDATYVELQNQNAPRGDAEYDTWATASYVNGQGTITLYKPYYQTTFMQTQAQVLVHEASHLAGFNVSDLALAQAAIPGYQAARENPAAAASAAYQSQLIKHCF